MDSDHGTLEELASAFPDIDSEILESIMDRHGHSYLRSYQFLMPLAPSTSRATQPGRDMLRYLQFVPIRTRSAHEIIQLCQIIIFTKEGVLKLHSATNPAGRNPAREGPHNIIDGLLETKWLDYQGAPLVLELETSIAKDEPLAYVLVTANDVAGRDPIRWRMEGSNNSSRGWKVLHDCSHQDQKIPRARYTATELFQTSHDFQAPASIEALINEFAPTIPSEQECIADWASKHYLDRPSEYRAAAEAICIEPSLMGSCRLDRKIALLEEKLVQSPLKNTFPVTAAKMISRAFGLCSKRRAYTFYGSVPGMVEGYFHRGLLVVHDALEPWQQRLLHATLREMRRNTPDQNDDQLRVTCGLLLHGSDKCLAAKHNAFMVTLDRLADTNDAITGENISRTLEDHKNILFKAAHGVIDDVKDGALKSVFTEPTKMYFRGVCDHTMEGDVDVHGSNVYLALLLAALGVKLARTPLLSDEIKRVANYMAALTENEKKQLWNPANAGKTWNIGHSLLNGSSSRRSSNNAIRRNEFFFGGRTAGQMAAKSLNTSSPSHIRKQFAQYLEAFAGYFAETFVVDLICRAILARDDLHPSLNAVFRDIAPIADYTEADGDAKQWLWDIFSGEFQQGRAVMLLRAAGIVRPIE